ncbi:unnamed protein product [marine sediment metagenome]|uniref:Uncharacterized protein n=1 Tax=marine sediment metagenome TaxID=412755 RepID=X1AY40_9ZZZZ
MLTFDLQISAKSVNTMNSGQLIPYDNDPDRGLFFGMLLSHFYHILRNYDMSNVET